MSLENSVASAFVVPASDGSARILGRFVRPVALRGLPKTELGKVVGIMVLFSANARPATN